MKLKSLRMVEHFLAATRTGRIHAAAKELGITQTAITRTIKELESILEVQLFDRSVRGVTLTAYGEQFLRRAIQIEAQIDYLERESAEMASGNAGTLKIGAGTVWSTMFLPKILVPIQAARPSARFIILRSVGTRFREQLEQREIDLGLGFVPSGGEVSEALTFEPLAKVRTIFLASKNHPLAESRGITHEDLASFPWAMFRLDRSVFELVRTEFLVRGIRLEEPHYLADSISSVMRFLSESDHVSCIPAPLLELAAPHGLVQLNAPEAPEFMSGAIYMSAASEYPLLNCVLQELRKGFGQLKLA